MNTTKKDFIIQALKDLPQGFQEVRTMVHQAVSDGHISKAEALHILTKSLGVVIHEAIQLALIKLES